MAWPPADSSAPPGSGPAARKSSPNWNGPRRRRGPLVAYLYRLDLAKPVRPMTPARRAALAKANAARRLCPACGRDAGYVIPASLGMCVPCADAPRLAA